MQIIARSLLCLAGAALLMLPGNRVAAAPPKTGPETEQRFPPLQLPAGFKATLFACDPLIEYPSVIALGPRPGTLYAAVDYMTGLGTEIVRRDEIRLLEDTDGDGYADKAAVYASGFNSIQGLAYHAGAVYVMHAPFLTRLRDTDNDGRADECRDLFNGLGLPPEKNAVRLHGANGVIMGHDGWLYLALGDHGADVQRPEGDRLVLLGGGILRCRPDGRDLHIFATGLRNIYDVALDDELNVFVRDNENDGGDYKIRVCHSFFGADHGYPYLYYEHPTEALPPMADLGLGSSAGGISYQETQFPPEYRGNLFFCEWGRSVVRYRPVRSGSSFAPLKEIEFAAGAERDPYGFKPTDLVVDYDGSLFVSDWADGQRPKRGRGRIYRIRHAEAKLAAAGPKPQTLEQWMAQLDAESYHARTLAQTELERRWPNGIKTVAEALARGRLGVHGRCHAIWIRAHGEGPDAAEWLLRTLEHETDPRVQVQAVRALADLADPVLVQHRLDGGVGDAGLAARLAALAPGRDLHVEREIMVALGRLRWSGAAAWLRLTQVDPALGHAAQQMLRACGNWPDVLRMLDAPSADTLRTVALRAVTDRAEPVVVDGLIERLRNESKPARRREYAELLTRVYKRRGSSPYWGYRPAPRPANTVAWERTDAIAGALDRALVDSDREVRPAILKSMQREKVVIRTATLGRWLQTERRPEPVAAILESMREQSPAEVSDLLAEIVRESAYGTANRRTALAIWLTKLDSANEERLLKLADSLEDGPVLADALRATGPRPQLQAEAVLLRATDSRNAEIRAAAVETLGERRARDAEKVVIALLTDPEATVRRAAAGAAGKLRLTSAADALLKQARDADAAVRHACLDALRQLCEPRVLPLARAALHDRQTARAALECISALSGPEEVAALVELAKHDPMADLIVRIIKVLDAWRRKDDVSSAHRNVCDRAIDEIQGTHGMLLCWKLSDPMWPDTATTAVQKYGSSPTWRSPGGGPLGWSSLVSASPEQPVALPKNRRADPTVVWLAYTVFTVSEPTDVQFLTASSGKLDLWLNGVPLVPATEPGPGRFTARAHVGFNRLLVRVSETTGTPNFHVRFRRRGSTAEHERLVQAALTRTGDSDRGRQLFFNVEKSQCLKCHRLGDQGERLGPELTGLASRFSRIYIIESILEPSRAVVPGFQTWNVALKDGRTLSGVKLAETAATLTLGDNLGQKHVMKKADIEEQQPQTLSTMPEGLEKRLTADEFVDLIAFLVKQKETR
jgi:putative membrane-bound dehydrogenase-like protein